MHVRPLVVGGAEAPLPHDGQRLRGERLVELDEVDIAQLQPGFGKCALGGRYRADAHHVGRHTRDGPRHQSHQRSEAEFGGPLRGGHQTHGRRVVLAAGIAGRNRCVWIILEQNGFELAQRFHRGVGARVLVGVDHLLATAAAHGDRNDLLGQNAVLLRGHRTLVRRHRELVLFLTRDVVLAAQVLRGLQHAAGHRVVAAAGGGASARQPVVHLHATAGTAPAHVGGIEGDVAHALRAAGNHEIVVAGMDLQARLDDRLQARAAAAVDLHAGHRHRQSGIKADDASDRRGLAVGIAVAENDILHRFGRDAGAVEQPGERGHAELNSALRGLNIPP